MSLTNEEKLNISISACKKLIEIDVKRIRNVSNVSSYKSDIISSLEKIFDFFEIDEDGIINKIYNHYEKKETVEDDFFDKLGFQNVNKKYQNDSIENCSKIYCELIEFAGGTVYGICQSYSNKKYPLYDLDECFFKLAYKFGDELDLPVSLINRKYSYFSTKEIEYDRDLSQMKFLSGYSWFQRNLDYMSQFEWHTDSEKEMLKNKIKEINKTEEDLKKDIENNNVSNERMKEFYKKLESRRNKKDNNKANGFKRINTEISTILSSYSLYNHEKSQFSCLTYFGFDKLIDKTYRHRKEYDLKNEIVESKLINKDISSKISNENIQELLSFFFEFGISGVLSEEAEVYDINEEPNKYIRDDGTFYFEKTSFGNPILIDLKISVSPKAKWVSDYKDDLEELLEYYGIKDCLKYEDNKPVIYI